MDCKLIIYLFIIAVVITSCKSKQFDHKESEKSVYLEKLDLIEFEKLKNLMIHDLVEIRRISKKLTSASDTTFLSTNSHYLFQIDKNSYKPIIENLKGKEIFKDFINTSYNGTLIFRLKEITDKSTQPKFSFIHDLVWNAEIDFHPPYSGTIKIHLDSAINENWRYIYYESQVGH